MRNKNMQKKKAIDCGLNEINPFIQNVGCQALDQLSTKIRPRKKYKTGRKDLDGGVIDIHKMIAKLPRSKAGSTKGSYKYMGPSTR